MDRPSFFISFEPVLPERALKPVSGGLPKWGAAGYTKPLVVRVLIVQNDRVPPLLTHRATTANRAEIGRLCRRLGHWPETTLWEASDPPEPPSGQIVGDRDRD